MTYREIVYMILDELKLLSDDAHFNEDHIKFLCTKYRAFLLKKNYANNKNVSSSNYQIVPIELEVVPTIEKDTCLGSVLKSKQEVPGTLDIGNTNVYTKNFTAGTNITYTTLERFKFVGHNKWLKNIIYCTKGPDDYLYFKSWNPQHLYLNYVELEGVFENVEAVKDLLGEDLMDTDFPMEDALVPQLIQSVVAELSPKTITPEDSINNASDDKANLARYLASNTKSELAKQLS